MTAEMLELPIILAARVGVFGSSDRPSMVLT
jgi:hypothetical protein